MLHYFRTKSLKFSTNLSNFPFLQDKTGKWYSLRSERKIYLISNRNFPQNLYTIKKQSDPRPIPLTYILASVINLNLRKTGSTKTPVLSVDNSAKWLLTCKLVHMSAVFFRQSHLTQSKTSFLSFINEMLAFLFCQKVRDFLKPKHSDSQNNQDIVLSSYSWRLLFDTDWIYNIPCLNVY